MTPSVRYLLLAAAPASAFLLAQKALDTVVSYTPRARPAAPPARQELVATVDRLQAEYDDLRAHQPAAKARKLKAAELALADAREDLYRHDIAAFLAG